MSLKTAFRTLLAADAAVIALVGDKIRPDKLDQGDLPLPAIVIEINDDESVESLEDLSSEGQATVSVACCAHSNATAETLAAAVQEALAGYRGVAGGLTLDPVTWVGTAHEHETTDDAGDDADWWFEVLTFHVWYRS
jgi:hypothetical protein